MFELFYYILTLISIYLTCKSPLGYSKHVDEGEWLSKWKEYQCHLYKDCNIGGVKVCGFDEEANDLVEFDEICTLHMMNCKTGRAFREVDKLMCQYRNDYDNIYNETGGLMLNGTTVQRNISILFYYNLTTKVYENPDVKVSSNKTRFEISQL